MGQASADFLKLKGDTKFVDLRPLYNLSMFSYINLPY